MDKIKYEDGIRITVEFDGEKLVLELPSDLDIYEWEKKLRLILKFISFDSSTINEILKDEETQEEQNGN